MLSRMHQMLARQPRFAVLAMASALLALVAALDYLSGNQVSVALFYLLAVAMAAWYANRVAGYTFAVLGSLVWYAVEIAGGSAYDSPLIPVWNALIRLGFFMIVAALLSALRDRLATERQLARTDGLTDVLNTRAFRAQLEHDLALADRLASPLTLVYLDLDDFKRINDTYGHLAGDQVLREVGHALKDAIRRTDTVARPGGDEFALILPGTDLDGAKALLAKLQTKLRESTFPDKPSVTCSIGAVVFRESPGGADAAMSAVDRLMYSAKTAGKDTVVLGFYSPEARRAIPVQNAAKLPAAVFP